MQNILIGYSICATLVIIILSWILYKRPTTKNEIANLKQKNKRNRDSSIDNDITPTLNIEAKKQRPKHRFRRKNKKA